MGPEINIDSILVLEKQIEQGLGDVIQLKRTRNSLLNISTLVPPELLGQTFRWNVIPDDDSDDLQKGSYNFLLVCHHWFEVACGTPELWTFWGNTLKQWSRQCQHFRTVPLDLVLRTRCDIDDENTIPFDGPLRDALRDRAACDSIRSIRLRGVDAGLIRSVISSLTLDGEDIRYSSIESLTLEPVRSDISDFFARYRFPKLRDLQLEIAGLSSWDHLKLQATSLTALSLSSTPPDTPTTSQLLSILTSYPNLQDLSLCGAMIPHDAGDGSTSQVPLYRLKTLQLTGICYHVFRLLRRLEYPDTLDLVSLYLLECTGEGVSEFLEPYVQDRIRRNERFQGKLAMEIWRAPYSISFSVDAFGEFNIPDMLPGHSHPSLWIGTHFKDALPQGADEKLCSNLVSLAPRECVVDFSAALNTHTVKDLLITMPNVEGLYLRESVVSDMFLQLDPPSHKKLLPSLQRLNLDYLTLPSDDDWSPLITYLIHQTSGGQAISFKLCGEHPPVPPEVVEEIESLVEEFNLECPDGTDL